MKTNSATGQGVLAIPTVQVCPMFERRSFVYRIGPDLYEADPYAEFLVPPSRALAIPMRACLRNCGVFREVLEAGSQREADTLLEVHAHELYGDFRKTGPPTAVLSIRILLFEAENGQPQSLLLQKFYTRRVPLKDKTAVALAAGWNQALAEIMAEATSDISTARGMTAAK